MTFEERVAKLQQVTRERQAIELAKTDLVDELQRLKGSVGGDALPPEIANIVRRLIALIDEEQQQVTILFELLEQAHADLAKAHEDLAEAHGDPPLAGH